MKRILYITDSLKQRFGVTSVIMNYLSNFDFTHVQIDVMAYNDSEHEIVKRIEELGGNVYFMPTLGLKTLLSFKHFIESFFKENKDIYGIVHSHFNQIDGIVFPIAKKYGANYCISHSHNTKWSENRFKAIRNKILCLPQKRVATHWFACSKVAGVFMFGNRFNTNPNAKIIKNAIDCTLFDYNLNRRNSLRSKHNINEKIVLGFVGSLKKQKNPCFVLDLFADLIRRDKNNKEKYCLMIVGTGPIENEVKQKYNELNLKDSDVRFLGRRTDVADLLQAFDILLLPSLYEGLPVTLVEAQITGIQCIVADTITKEVSITPNITYLPITEGTEIWCKSILNVETGKRSSQLKEVIKSGYEIKTAARELEKYYLRLLSE